jgi:hypothetical protein
MVSVSWRLERTTTEGVFVPVLITADLIVKQPDGTGRIDVEMMVKRALAMGLEPDVAWQLESQRVEPHPVQIAPPGLLPCSPGE